MHHKKVGTMQEVRQLQLTAYAIKRFKNAMKSAMIIMILIMIVMKTATTVIVTITTMTN